MGVEIEDNTDQIIEMMEITAKRALTECGMLAEEFAKNACPVDTGLLHNSITYALDGETAALTQYKADRGKKGRDGIRSSDIKEGEPYTGQMPKEGGEGTRSVYIGTNVEYAIYVHEGTGGDKKKGPRPFIRDAVANHVDKYKEIIKSHLEGAN